MKTNKLIYIVLVGIILVIGSRYITVESNKRQLEDELKSSHREVEDLNNMIIINDTISEEILTTKDSQLDDYEAIIAPWMAYGFNATTLRELLRKSYDIRVIVHVADRSFPLPKNGIINVNSDAVELEIKYKLQPHLIDSDLNDLLHYHDEMFEDIKYDDPDEYFEDENTIRIKYNDLALGDKRNIFMGRDLQYYLELTDSRIQISHTEIFQDSKDYQPVNIKVKKFTGGLFRRGFTHYITYQPDGSWILDTDDELTDWILMYENDNAVRVKFEYDEELKVTGVSSTELELNKHDRVVLPSKLEIGSSWEANNLMAMITAVDYSLDTGLGILDTIEVTYKEENGHVAYISYFAKNIGLVYRRSSRYDDDLYDVVYYK